MKEVQNYIRPYTHTTRCENSIAPALSCAASERNRYLQMTNIVSLHISTAREIPIPSHQILLAYSVQVYNSFHLVVRPYNYVRSLHIMCDTQINVRVYTNWWSCKHYLFKLNFLIWVFTLILYLTCFYFKWKYAIMS